MTPNKLISITALTVATALASPSSFALTSFTNLLKFDGSINTAQDQSAELAVRYDGSVWNPIGASDTLQIGDVLAGVFFMDSVGVTGVGNATYTGFSGYFATQIATIGATESYNPIGGGPAIDVADFTFTNVTDTSVWNAVFGIDPTSLAAGTMTVWSEDTNSSFTSTDFGTIAGAISEATSNTTLFTTGFKAGNADNFWNAFNAPLNISDLLNLLPTENVGQFQFGVNVLDNYTSWIFDDVIAGKDNEVVSLSGNVLAPQPGNAFPIEDDIKVAFRVTVPEPTSLALLGIGLLGLGANRIRRQA